jgi:lysophospholipase L1-like esterase
LIGGQSPSPWFEATNLGFERGRDVPEGWSVLGAVNGTADLVRDTETKREGQSSLRVETGGQTRARIGQRVAAEPGTRVKVAGWVRGEGSGRANVFFAPVDRKGVRLEFKQLRFVPGTRDWESFSGEATLPPNAVGFEIGVLVEGDQRVWLDDFQVEASAPVGFPRYVKPELQDPILPYPGQLRGDTAAWLGLYQRQVEIARSLSPRVVFLGDSITEMWEPELWASRFAPLGAVNFGIRGDRTNQVLWRLRKGALDGVRPALVVVAIGVNNLWRDRYGNGRIAQGVGRIVREVQAQLPEAQVLLVGVLPTGNEPKSSFRGIVSDLNAKIRRYADGRRVWMVDFGTAFLAEDGSIPKRLMPDGLHLSAAGYRVFTDRLTPVIREILLTSEHPTPAPPLDLLRR